MTTVVGNGLVEFRFYRPGARDVRLAGDFNGWGKGQAMEPQGNGWWVSRVELDGGEYRFRYVADGEWYTDFASHGIEFTKLGWNSVLVVPSAPAPASRVEMEEDDSELLVA